MGLGLGDAGLGSSIWDLAHGTAARNEGSGEDGGWEEVAKVQGSKFGKQHRQGVLPVSLMQSWGSFCERPFFVRGVAIMSSEELLAERLCMGCIIMRAGKGEDVV